MVTATRLSVPFSLSERQIALSANVVSNFSGLMSCSEGRGGGSAVRRIKLSDGGRLVRSRNPTINRRYIAPYPAFKGHGAKYDLGRG
jgi:hypothetical protein